MRECFVIWAGLRGGQAVMQANYSEWVTREEMEKRLKIYSEKYPDAKLVVYREVDETKLDTKNLYARPGRIIPVCGDPTQMSMREIVETAEKKS